MRSISIFLIVLAGLSLSACKTSQDANVYLVGVAVKENVSFKQDVAPVIADKCISCHQGVYYMNGKKVKPKDGVRLDNKIYYRELIVAGKPLDSELFDVLIPKKHPISRKLNQMPPTKSGGPLTKAEIGLIRDWIKQGANFADWEKFDKDTLRKHQKK